MEEDDEIVDMTVAIDIDSMPYCLFCDRQIVNYAPSCLITAHGLQAIVHTQCLMIKRRELGI